MSIERPEPAEIPARARAVLDRLSSLKVDPEHLDVGTISDTIEELFSELGTEDVGDVIADSVTQGLLSQEQANKALEIAIWSGETNGLELSNTIERWLLTGDDPVRIAIALTQPIFPFATLEAMRSVLSKVAARWPQFAEPLNAMIERRREQGV